MTNRTFKLAAAALSVFVGGLTPSLAQQQPAPAPQAAAAADACQASPKGAAPQGKHWYYHTDRSAGRKCWYLGEVGMKTTTSAAAKHKPAPPAEADTDAAPSPRQNASDTPARTEPAAKGTPLTASAPETATDPGAENNTTAQPAPDAIAAVPAATPLLTERWPAADAFRPSQTTTGQSTALANAQPATSETPASAPAPSEVTPAAATPENTPAASQPADLTPWRVIFGVSFLVLALIAILALVTFRYFWRTDDKVRNVPGRLRNIWGDDKDETAAAAPSYAEMIAPSRRTSARAPQDLDEIEQLLRRAAREPNPENVISLADPATRARTPTAPSAARASAVRHAGSFRPR
ncbi:MAG: hypothetical protein J0G33_09305 [Afipia felis]|nr:hypothetical protein [Afipia felis]